MWHGSGYEILCNTVGASSLSWFHQWRRVQTLLAGSAPLVSVGWVERVLTVEFGPSRSKRFAKAVAEAQSGAGECNELEPGSYRMRAREDDFQARHLSRLRAHNPEVAGSNPAPAMDDFPDRLFGRSGSF